MALFQLNCGTVKIKDQVWWGSLGPFGAAEYHTLKEDHRDLTIEEWVNIWNDLERPVACTSVDVMLEQKGNLEKLCSYYNACTYEEIELAKKLDRNIKELREKQKQVRQQSF